MKIHEKISNVIYALKAIPKDTKGQSGNRTFQYRSYEAMMYAVKPLMKEHGLIFLPSDSELIEIGHKISLIYRCIIQDIENDEKISFTFQFVEDEKQLNAVMNSGSTYTYARRYAYEQIFDIPNEESDPNKHDLDLTYITEKQRTELSNYAKECGISNDDMKKLISKVGAPNSKLLTPKQYLELVKLMENF